MTNRPIFTGSGVAIVTPFKDGYVDFDKLGELIDFQIENHTDAIIICGTTGEASTMPDEEHLAAVEYTVKKVAGRVPVVAGAGSNDTRHCIHLSQKCEELGADALLLVTPYYNKTTQQGLIKHYTMVADSVNIPIILYNVPGRTNLTIQPDTLLKLSEHKNIVAIKEASGNISLAAHMAAKCGDKIDIYSGNDDCVVPLMSLGGLGVISVVANVAPKEMHDMCQAYLDGDIEKARELQLKIMELNDAMFCEVNPIPVKAAMNLLGYNVGELRMPLCEPESKNLEVIKKALINFGFELK